MELQRAKAAHADVMHAIRWRRSPAARITRRFVARHGLTVQAGPFAGMRYPQSAVGRAEMLVAKLLGSYERELHGAIAGVCSRSYDSIVDIGAADGYYAVGLARTCRDSTVYAYEMNPLPARVCRGLAEANGVAGRVVVRGECRVADLLELPDTPTFVLCDSEGAEAELIDPAKVPLLRRSDLIVELHEWIAPGIRRRIEERFGATHEIEVITSEPRYVADYPALLDVPATSYMDHEVGLSEYRPFPMAWAVLTRSG